jgi:hypothetical protein
MKARGQLVYNERDVRHPRTELVYTLLFQVQSLHCHKLGPMGADKVVGEAEVELDDA